MSNGIGIDIHNVSAQLEKAGPEPDVFDKCGIEAPVSAIEGLALKVRKENYDLLVGVGGGSNMATTKADSIIAANDGITIQDLLEDIVRLMGENIIGLSETEIEVLILSLFP